MERWSRQLRSRRFTSAGVESPAARLGLHDNRKPLTVPITRWHDRTWDTHLTRRGERLKVGCMARKRRRRRTPKTPASGSAGMPPAERSQAVKRLRLRLENRLTQALRKHPLRSSIALAFISLGFGVAVQQLGMTASLSLGAAIAMMGVVIILWLLLSPGRKRTLLLYAAIGCGVLLLFVFAEAIIPPTRTESEEVSGLILEVAEGIYHQACKRNDTNQPSEVVLAVSRLHKPNSHVRVTVGDPDGCLAYLSEVGAAEGQLLQVENGSSYPIILKSVAGVQELRSRFTANKGEAITLRYSQDRWIEVQRLGKGGGGRQQERAEPVFVSGEAVGWKAEEGVFQVGEDLETLLLKAEGLTAFQSKQLFAPYVGKWYAVEGTVRSVIPPPRAGLPVFVALDASYASIGDVIVLLAVDSGRFSESLSHIGAGYRVKAKGRIESLTYGSGITPGLDLYSATLIEVSGPQ